jgi:hypothetical protein
MAAEAAVPATAASSPIAEVNQSRNLASASDVSSMFLINVSIFL